MINKKNIFLWSLYDFANSVIMITTILYFSQWLVIDKGMDDIWFNLSLIITSLLYLFVGPVFGQISDKIKNRMRGLRITTILSFIFFGLTGFVMTLFSSHVFLAISLFTIAFFFYSFSFLYYTPLIAELGPENIRGRISGIGQGVNVLGQVLGLLFILPFANGTFYLLGEPGRAQTILPATIIFGVLALPMLIWFKEKSVRQSVDISFQKEYRQLWITTKTVFSIVGVGAFLWSYFFFSDSLLTFSNNFPIFLEKVFGVNDTVKSYMIMAILSTSVIGSLISGWISDKFGHKLTLIWILCGWVIILPAIAFAQSFNFAMVIFVVGGFWHGAVWTVSRALVADLAPPENVNTVFSFYILAERFATFVGPIAWSLTLLLTKNSGILSYRYAMLVMAFLIVIGLWILRGVRYNNHIGTVG